MLAVVYQTKFLITSENIAQPNWITKRSGQQAIVTLDKYSEESVFICTVLNWELRTTTMCCIDVWYISV